MPQLSSGKNPYGLPHVVVPIWITSTSTPARPFITASLAEHVPEPVRTNTRDRPRNGSTWPGVAENPSALSRNGVGVSGLPLNGSWVGYLSLNISRSNVLPAVAVGPATM